MNIFRVLCNHTNLRALNLSDNKVLQPLTSYCSRLLTSVLNAKKTQNSSKCEKCVSGIDVISVFIGVPVGRPDVTLKCTMSTCNFSALTKK